MTGFFETLAARAVGVSPGLRPRAAHRFEPTTRGGGVGRAGAGASPAPWNAPASDDVGADRGLELGLGLELDSLVESARSDSKARTGLRGAPSPPRARESGERAAAPPAPRSDSPREVVADSPLEPVPPSPEAARAAARRDVRDLARDAARATHELDRPSTSQAPQGDRPARTRANADDAAHGRSEQARPVQPAPSLEGTRDRPEPSGGDPQPASDQTRALSAAAPRLRWPAQPTSRPAPGPAPGPDVDLAALLREEVFAALLDRGAVPARERPVVVPPGERVSPPRPGTAAIRAEGVSSAVRAQPRAARDGAAGEAGPPSVHLHIDRVSVTRAAPPAPATQSQGRSSVDHAAYLARRRERG